ncbi:ribosome biogenesis GTP-binding protein YihA/YsxC [Thermoflavifilum thermophilum]|uniref:Probable GTP-binding protein EngB n=1 Tax=Thermoflavifilum thermophilum TaxID=1393122 RepID=A0A1I7N6P3_9BACT|nr:ribosome biogenesis GTP-binding protein YihA/YsxC [Thermoflavifilum thermophilum]SFV30321.1 GTP-binding protein [Thermoflavifilum thermophilum]
MEIISARLVSCSADVQKCPKPHLPEYAFVGRSNVGKSSFINMLTGQHRLAKTSATPGKTQTINHYIIESRPDPLQRLRRGSWYLVDLPGYGYARQSLQQRKNWQQLIQSYLQQRKNLVYTFLLIDSSIPPQTLDLNFADQLGQWQIPFVLIFTKTDKEKQNVVHKHMQAFLKEMEKRWQHLPPYFLASAKKKTGRKEILEFIQEWNTRFQAIA